MSAMTGICDFRAMAGRASASSWLGQATRTMSQPGRGQLGDLLERGVDVGRRRRRHRLDRDREVAADAHLADPDLAGLAPGREDGRGQGRHAEGDSHGAIIPSAAVRAHGLPNEGVSRRC